MCVVSFRRDQLDGHSNFVASTDVLLFSVKQAVRRERELGSTLAEYDAQYGELQRIIATLPTKDKHEIMVPCTKFAMFQGELEGKANLFVGIGGDLLVERSAQQTVEIIERRRELLRNKMRDAETNASAMESRLYAMEALQASGGASLPAVPEGEELVEDGRAKIARKGDGSVEITEIYEADEDFSALSTLAPSSENERPDAGTVRGDLDDFIARLEAMEMNDSGEASTSCVDGDDDVVLDGEYDIDVDIDGGEPPTIECPEDFVKYERWKAKREAKDAELRRAAEQARVRADEEKIRIEDEIRRRNPPVKSEVIERVPGQKSTPSSSHEDDPDRKLSRYQMKKLGLL